MKERIQKSKIGTVLPNVLLFWFVMLLNIVVQAQNLNSSNTCKIDITEPEKQVHSGLDLGGTNDAGESIAVNNFYLSRNQKPIIPITGEFHYSRYPEQYWDEAIKKMKAGGITMIATYVFWIEHEEVEGKFDFKGNRNLRKFIELCAKNDMPVILRIGPFDHGEMRNGGLPDWLLAKPLSVRSNDPKYLFYVERLFNKIGKETKGLFFKDDGPIIATQIENEYQHSAAPWGLTYPGQPLDYTSADRDQAFIHKGVSVSKAKNPYAALGNNHMKTLKTLAVKAGIITPLYTATGWGNAAIIPKETLPVTAAYAYPTWIKDEKPSPFYQYKKMYQNPDYSPVRYTPEDYPAFPAELGAGIMDTYKRRPVVPAKSIDALINRCLGSGANGIGYYMYHGGSTFRGKHSFMNDEAGGYNKISYDFQAPIGEFGQTRQSYHRLKLIHFFLNSFANLLAPMSTVLPKSNQPLTPSNTKKLRYAVRHKGDSGFLFINNFQDHLKTTDKKNIHLQLKTAKGVLEIPEKGGFTIKTGENVIFPFNLNMEGFKLSYATAQLLTKLKAPKQDYYVFFAPEGVKPEFSFKKTKGLEIENSSGAEVKVKENRWLVNCPQKKTSGFILKRNGKTVRVLVISKKLALTSWEVRINQQKHLIFSSANVLQEKNGLQFLSKNKNIFDVGVYPKNESLPKIKRGSIAKKSNAQLISEFRIKLPRVQVPYQNKKVSKKRLVVSFTQEIPKGLHDVILKIDYTGDTAMGFMNGKLVADQFYNGKPWEVGLRRFVNKKRAKSMNFYFRPMYKNAPYLVDLNKAEIPDFTKHRKFLKINKVDFIPIYQSIINFNK